MTYHKRSWMLLSRRLGKLGRAGLGAGLLAGILSLPLCSPAVRALLTGAASADEPAEGKDDKEDDDVAFPNSAQLKTNAELDRLLAAAEQYATDKRYDLAARIWQNVLDQTSDTLMTREDKPAAEGEAGSKGIDIVAAAGEEKWVYRVSGRAYRRYVSINSEIERRLAKLPPEALKLYRIMADGLAKSEMAAAQGDQMEERLASVVRRFFLSSYGDDAAYQLGCLALDRYDFVGASRMFAKVLEEHPDPSIPRHELLARLALAQARVGDSVAANKALADLKASVGYDRELLNVVSADLSTAAPQTVAQTLPRDQWPMALGSPARDGVMRAPALGDKPGTLVSLWNASFSLNQASFGINTATDSNVRYGTSPFRIERGATAGWVSANGVPNRDQVMANWKKNNWHPTSQVLLDNGRVYFKTNRTLLCLESDSGELIWKSRDSRYAGDPVSRWLTQMGQFQQQATMNGRPSQPPEVMLFGDRVPMSISIAGDMVLCVEGDPEDKPVADPQQQIRSPYGYNVIPRRSRRNLINAHHATTGKYLWTRTLDDGKSSRSETGFLAAPVPYGKLLIVPVSDNGALWIYALSRETGENVWKTFLCEDPEGGASSWATTGITVNGGEVYVASGGGVIFAVNATSGNIRWATRYQRTNADPPQTARRGGVYGGGIAQMPSIMSDQVGFDEDTVIAHGKQLVVMPSDSSNIFALDRRTGAFLWDSSRGSDRYCLGVVGDIVYTGGNVTKISTSEQSQGAKEKSLGSVIRGYHITSGKLVIAEVMVNSFSLGRGLAADDGLYVPVKDSIVKFDLKTGKQVSQIGVTLPGGEPVGNIVTDGQRFFVAGMERLTAVALPAEKTKTLQSLAKSDKSRTRLRAARALINAGDRQGLQVLADLLEDPDEAIRTASVKMLRIATEQKLEFDPLAPEDTRKADRAKWAEWIKGEGQSAALKTPLAEETEGDATQTISIAVPPPTQQSTQDPFGPRVESYSIELSPSIIVTEEGGVKRVIRSGRSRIEKTPAATPPVPTTIKPSSATPPSPSGPVPVKPGPTKPATEPASTLDPSSAPTVSPPAPAPTIAPPAPKK